MKTIAPLVAEPMTIHCFVDSRFKTSDAVLVGFDADIATGAAAGADGRRLLQVPDADFEAEIAIRERAHRTDINDVAGQWVIQNRVGKQCDGRMIAAIDDRKFVGARNFLKKAHTARTFDAALAVEYNVGTENFPLAVVLLSLLEAAPLQIMLHVIVLQPALPRLVTDWTIQWVVDEEKLHHRFADRQNFRALGQYRHPLRHRRVTGNLELRHLLDLDETHAAVTGDGKLRVVAVVRDIDAYPRRHLDKIFAFGGDNLFAVDGELNRIHKS